MIRERTKFGCGSASEPTTPTLSCNADRVETDRLEPHAYHHMQIYKDEVSLAAIVVRLVVQARRVGQPALVISTASNRRKIDEALKAENITVEGTEGAGVEILDTHHVLQDILVDDRPDPGRFREVVGSILERLCRGREPCVPVIYADMADVLVSAGNTSAALSLEILWNRLAANYTFSLLCGYAASTMHERVPTDKELQEICDQHNYVRRFN
jgi:hypothetical protein